jgi:uncharacterized protein YcbK (DUF882 family)
MRIAMSMSCCAVLVAALAGAGEPRSLSFVHTHSGEQLTCTFAGGSDDAGCRAQLGHLLRDWRNGESHAMDPALFDLLYDLRRLAQSDAPFEIISAYRSPATNELLRSRSSGVSEKSLHMQGRALDVRLRGFPTARLLPRIGFRARGYGTRADLVSDAGVDLPGALWQHPAPLCPSLPFPMAAPGSSLRR